ncbi:ATP-binding protein [Rhizobiaceae bacterium BDR2-2]|uniref:histidine kinase n=1 Tax=Ectorhizobium quercum TaxID=2965071 RepID=A0AAE3N1Z9_9HYPH|nr:ATP-binding protein [Ectorhizobium quercum]MCX8998487.1 ATP-binding protein [Ectorhizobium quercum]
MADRIALGLAGAMAPHVCAGDRADGDTARVNRFARRLAVASAVAVFAAPLALAGPLGLAVALPAGVTSAGCLLLVGLTVGMQRFGRAGKAEFPAAGPGEAADPYVLCPGLVLGLDLHGAVVRMSGRDAAGFTHYLRAPAGRPLIEQIHVSDRLVFAAALDRLRGGERAAEVEVRLERRAGAAKAAPYLHARASLTPVSDAEGALSGIFCQMTDIGAERALRDAACAAERQAENANEAKSRFLAAVSHELRTPLNAILGFSDILIGEYFGRLENDRQREYVRLIRQSGGHLLSVVNTMLDMSKIEAGRYELVMDQFAVADVVHACEAMLSLQAREKGVTLTARIQRDLGEAIADQRALQQVLINLVGNAIKFTDAGGVVSVDAVAECGWLKITVGDTGIGIAPEKLSMVGQPFMQVQDDLARQYEGTGLGLSLVKGLVALHGGTFSIDSKPGEGTVVTVIVPMDGSGIHPDEEAGDGRMVEFPPRLRGGQASAAKHWDDAVYENAEAQSA